MFDEPFAYALWLRMLCMYFKNSDEILYLLYNVGPSVCLCDRVIMHSDFLGSNQRILACQFHGFLDLTRDGKKLTALG